MSVVFYQSCDCFGLNLSPLISIVIKYLAIILLLNRTEFNQFLLLFRCGQPKREYHCFLFLKLYGTLLGNEGLLATRCSIWIVAVRQIRRIAVLCISLLLLNVFVFLARLAILFALVVNVLNYFFMLVCGRVAGCLYTIGVLVCLEN